MIKHHKLHRKFYFIVNNLFEMFIEKSNKKNKNVIQKKLIFSNFFKFSMSSGISILSNIASKIYMIMNKLFDKIAKKNSKNFLNII